MEAWKICLSVLAIFALFIVLIIGSIFLHKLILKRKLRKSCWPMRYGGFDEKNGYLDTSKIDKSFLNKN